MTAKKKAEEEQIAERHSIAADSIGRQLHRTPMNDLASLSIYFIFFGQDLTRWNGGWWFLVFFTGGISVGGGWGGGGGQKDIL